MKRRQLLQYAGTGVLSAIATTWVSRWNPSAAQSPENAVTIQFLGHTCFLFTGNGVRILVNPFRNLGCTDQYRLPQIEADIVLISSQLLDEGAAIDIPGNPQILYEPGVFQFRGIEFQGISIDHDREGGRRFGKNVAWRWTQSGVNILHLGGAAAPISIEEKILMGRPDVALIPVGGGPKAYNAVEARDAMAVLNPKVAIPTHYRTEAANDSCDLAPVDEFLKLVQGQPVKQINYDKIAIKPGDLRNLGENTPAIRVLSHQNALK